MAWTAVEKIEEAAKQTRELLLPFEPGFWAKLTFLTFLTGSGLSTAFLQTSYTPNTGMHQGMMYTPSPQISNLVIAIAGLIISLGFIFMLLNSIAEFALFKTILTKKAKLWSYFKENTGRGLRYMAYRIAVLITAVTVSGLAVLIFAINPLLGLLSLLLLIPIFIALAVFDLLLRDFVLLEMLESDQGLLESIRTVYRDFRPQWKEVAVYIIVRIVLTAAIGVAVATAAGFTGLMFAVPAVIVLMLTELSLIFVLPLIALALMAVAVMVAVSMPFQVYLYSYKMEVYTALKK
ncbi:hypothetical protein ACK3SF_01530 [Candidatus Nanosalina sp. VS9-1]|uniref:DUF7544 domain-containing protein n=1 Tax=Candidatus Nanosalina sp. VS9-1 TaxID=3388566 RepID=UPI0039E09FD0